MLKPVFTIILLLLSVPSHAFLADALSLPPQADYQIKSSLGFDVVYPRGFETEAEETLALLERAAGMVNDFFAYEPRRKVTIILADNEDFANGVTSAIGHQGIVLYLTPPEPYTSIGEHSHWQDMLIIHEYAHYATLDRARGFFEGLRIFFGDYFQPNHLWPSWMAEGLAVYAETAFTDSGRGTSAHYRSLTRDILYNLRKNTNRDFTPQFDMLSGPRPKFPFGEFAYFTGYSIVEQMAHELGPKSLRQFTEESSFRVAYFMNGTLENITDETKTRRFRDFWKNYIDRKKTEMKSELDWLEAHELSGIKLHSPRGDSTIGARLSNDGHTLAYFSQSGDHWPALVLQNVETGEKKHLDDVQFNAGLAFSSDSKKIYYSKTENRGPFHSVSDLYEIDIETSAIKRLTNGERAKDPDLCGDSTLVFTSRVENRTVIKTFNLTTGEINTVTRADRYHNISNPRCSTDGKSIYYSEHALHPYDMIYKLELGSGSSAPVLLIGGKARDSKSGSFRALYPDPQPDGTLVFTKVEDSFYDLAKYDPKTGSHQTLARSSGEFLMPRSKNGNLAFTYLTSHGKYAATLDIKNLSAVSKSDFKLASHSAPQSTMSVRKQSPLTETPKLQSSTQDYNAITRGFVPRTWSPHLVYLDYHKELGWNFTGWDDVGQLTYSLGAYFDDVTKRVHGSVSTQHRIHSFKLIPQISSETTAVVKSSTKKIYYSYQNSAGLVIARPIPHAFYNITPYLIGQWARAHFGGPDLKEATSPEIRFGGGVSYDSRRRYGYSLDTEGGQLIDIDGRRYLTNNHSNYKFLARWNLNFGLPYHSYLNLDFFAVHTPRFDLELPGSVILVGGRGSLSNLNPPLRGYSQGLFKARQAGIATAELGIPFSQIFNGYDTLPIFIKNFGIYGFYDAAKLKIYKGTRSGELSAPITSTGGGILGNFTVGYHASLRVRIEFAHGFRSDLGGEDVVALYIGQ